MKVQPVYGGIAILDMDANRRCFEEAPLALPPTMVKAIEDCGKVPRCCQTTT